MDCIKSETNVKIEYLENSICLGNKLKEIKGTSISELKKMDISLGHIDYDVPSFFRSYKGHIHLEIIAMKAKEWYFFFKDINTYLEILKRVLSQKYVKEIEEQIESDSGAVFAFWKHIAFSTIQKYELSVSEYINPVTSDIIVLDDTSHLLPHRFLNQPDIGNSIWVSPQQFLNLFERFQGFFPENASKYISEKDINSYKDKLRSQFGDIAIIKKEFIQKYVNLKDESTIRDLYILYQKNGSILQAAVEVEKALGIETNATLYARFFENCRIVILYILEHLPKYAHAFGTIDQEMLNKALMDIYGAKTIEELKQKEKKYIHIQNQKSGNIGEKEVNYALKWLDKSYIVIKGEYSEECNNEKVVLYNPQYIDEPQEYDHIVIGKQGVFLIETKNYSGKIIIDTAGNWIRIKKDGQEVGERNPFQQILRHEKLIKSMIDVPVMSILCIANPKAVIKGARNSKVPIIKVDLLVDYIETYKSKRELSDIEQQQCKEILINHMI